MYTKIYALSVISVDKSDIVHTFLDFHFDLGKCIFCSSVWYIVYFIITSKHTTSCLVMIEKK
jgi:hypothetical protein